MNVVLMFAAKDTNLGAIPGVGSHHATKLSPLRVELLMLRDGLSVASLGC